MPLLPGTRTPIEIAVSDRISGDTIIKQKARFKRLIHEQFPTGECVVYILLEVTMYAAQGAEFGPALVGKGFAPYEVPLTADNQTVVDAAPGPNAGAILAIRSGQDDTDWQALLNSYEQPVMLQADFFEYLRDNAPIQIAGMIRQHIAAADAMGKFSL
jgi:hypothetical protein